MVSSNLAFTIIESRHLATSIIFPIKMRHVASSDLVVVVGVGVVVAAVAAKAKCTNSYLSTDKGTTGKTPTHKCLPIIERER